MRKLLKLSVHQLVDFLLRSGDIDNRIFNKTTMQEGTRLHSLHQSRQNDDYIPEYELVHSFFYEDVQITLEGRADGVFKKIDGTYSIDEIKTTTQELKTFRDNNIEWHLGQAKCYAYMYASDKKLPFIGVRLTYIRQGKEKEKRIEDYVFSFEELDQFIHTLLDDYLSFYNLILRYQEERNSSIKDLKFPFKTYRSGQRELAKYCYAIAKNGGRFYCEAPTGIGKTMSTLFPFIKAMTLDDQTKIFYLTAKGSGKEAAYNAIELLKQKGLVVNDILVTAKEKICFNNEKNCNPDECPYAKAYYNKIQGVLRYALLNHSTFDLNTITSIAKDNQVCPFEFELDLSLFCDVIICDYNYLFDPMSYMKRYFDEDATHYLALVDEAHNLIDRSRDMYSQSIYHHKYKEAKKSVRKSKDAKLKKSEAKLNKIYKELVDTYEDGETILDNLPDHILRALNNFVEMYQDLSSDENNEVTPELLDYYLDVLRFVKLYEFYNSKYILYIYKKDDEADIHLYCKDASAYISESLDKIKGAVIFSATLEPINYYVDTLGGNKESDPSLILPSPFPIDNLKILVAPKVSIKYKNRDASYLEVVEYIKSFISNKVGNYFIYSPSYEYMNRLLEHIDLSNVDYFIQDKEMNDIERQDFLLNFKNNPNKTTLGFLVIGGAFSEGIDLVSDRLIGAIIIGIGMPKINFRSDQIAEYYKQKDMPGHDYAYLYPGMNKIMQAVGRVIRSENDRGAVLLIDERYMSHQYQDLYRAEWKNYEVVLSPNEVKDSLTNFFKN